MGLDMYANTTRQRIRDQVDFQVKTCEMLHYWRQHPDLHGLMFNLYIEKGGSDHNFNCSNLRLTMRDLSIIESEIKSGSLPKTEGFFFGESNGSEKEDDLLFIQKARYALKNGLIVFYRAWW